MWSTFLKSAKFSELKFAYLLHILKLYPGCTDWTAENLFFVLKWMFTFSNYYISLSNNCEKYDFILLWEWYLTKICNNLIQPTWSVITQKTELQLCSVKYNIDIVKHWQYWHLKHGMPIWNLSIRTSLKETELRNWKMQLNTFLIQIRQKV